MSEENFSVNVKDWRPIGNYVMLKPYCLNPNELIPEHLQEKEAWKVLGFGTAYEAIEDISEGDIVLVIEYEDKKEGIKMNIAGEGEIWFYPPSAIVAKVVEE